MKTEIRLAEHSELAGAAVIELWYDGRLIGAVYGADGPGVRVISKHHIIGNESSKCDMRLNVVSVKILA